MKSKIKKEAPRKREVARRENKDLPNDFEYETHFLPGVRRLGTYDIYTGSRCATTSTSHHQH
jgi:hypothetical protein